MRRTLPHIPPGHLPTASAFPPVERLFTSHKSVMQRLDCTARTAWILGHWTAWAPEQGKQRYFTKQHAAIRSRGAHAGRRFAVCCRAWLPAAADAAACTWPVPRHRRQSATSCNLHSYFLLPPKPPNPIIAIISGSIPSSSLPPPASFFLASFLAFLRASRSRSSAASASASRRSMPSGR